MQLTPFLILARWLQLYVFFLCFHSFANTLYVSFVLVSDHLGIAFFPRLKNVQLFVSPPNLQKYFEKCSPAFSEHCFILFQSPSTLSIPAVCRIASHLASAIDKIDSLTLPMASHLVSMHSKSGTYSNATVNSNVFIPRWYL